MCSSECESRELPVWRLSDDAVEQEIARLDADEARLTGRRAELLREAQLRALNNRTHASTPDRWLRDRYRWSLRTATARLREADSLQRQPVVHRALAAGRVTVEQAVVIAGTLDQVGGLERVNETERTEAADLLLDQAGTLDPRDLDVVGRDLVEHLTRTPSVDNAADAAAVAREQEAAEVAAPRADQNRLTIRRRPDGSITGRFTLRPLDAPIARGWLKQADLEHPGDGGFADQRDRDQRRGDHLAATLRDALTVTPVQRAAGAKNVQVRIVVTTRLQDLQRGVSGVALLSTKGTLTAAELRRLACQAGIIPAVLGGDPLPLDLGRSSREFNPAQLNAFAVRDRGCVAPGCTRAPADCHGHHRWEWDLGGPTDLANGALLCAFHHLQVHRQHWKVLLAANGYPALIPPPTIDPLQRPVQHHRFQLPERRTA